MGEYAKFNRETFENCCKVGHNIVSLQTDSVFDLAHNVYIPQFMILCSKCGAGLEDIQKPRRPLRASNGKKKKGFTVEPETPASPPAP